MKGKSSFLLAVILTLGLIILDSQSAKAQNFCPNGPGGAGINAGPDTSVTCGSCVNLNAQIRFGLDATSYTVNQIPWTPFSTAGSTIVPNMAVDDRCSGLINIGFPFCFFGSTYNQCVLSSNGVLTFQAGLANAFIGWNIAGPIPGTNGSTTPYNSIYFPCQDLLPAQGGQIRTQTIGSTPCRVFVATFFNVPFFSCTNLLASQQVALYEATNVIETYIANKPTCNNWNGGRAIHGIQNATGTVALTVPGRNATQWNATNDAWRFTPNGAPITSVQWFQGANPIGNGATVQVCPLQNTTYTAQVTYNSCSGVQATMTDAVNVAATGTQIQIPSSQVNVACFGDSTGSATALPPGSPNIYQYVWNTTPPQTTQTATGLPAGTYIVNAIDTVNCIIGIDTLTITEPPLLTATATGVDVLCFGTNTGSLSGAAAGGTPGYGYSWNTIPPTNSANAGSVPAGTYILTVTDNNQCQARDTVTITQPPLLTGATSSVSTLCFGSSDGTATITPAGGTPGYSYSWATNPPQSTQTATNLFAGTYTVTLFDTNGCSYSTTVTVAEPAALVVQMSSTDATCFGGSNGTGTAQVSGGTTPYSYAWSNGAQTPTANGLSAGNYTCVVSDNNGCIDSGSVVINEPPPLQLTTTAIDVSCQGFSDGQLYVVAAGGSTPYTYLWSPGGFTTSGITNLAAGVYQVTVTDANNCSVTTTDTVGFPAPPVANAGPDTNFCEGEGGAPLFGVASGGQGSPYYYNWYCNQPICGLDSIFDNDPLANPTITTTYYLVVTDQRGCQSAPDSVIVTVKPKPRVNAGPDLYICEPPDTGTFINASISNAPGPYIYQWTPSAGLNNPNIEDPYARPNTTTIYYLIVSSSNGCTSDFNTMDTLSSVTVNVSPQPVAHAGADQSICYNGSTVLQGTGTGGNGTYQYQWSPATGLNPNPNMANPVASPPLTTVYILTVISNGCPSDGDTMTLFVQTNPTTDAGPDRDYCYGQSAVLQGSVGGVIGNPNFTYTWSPATGLSDPTSATPTVSVNTSTMYYLYSTSIATGCNSPVDSVMVTVNPSPIPDAGPNVTICAGNSTQLNGTYSWYNNNAPGNLANFFISWTPATTLDNPAILNPNATPGSTTIYYLTTTNLTCTYTDSVIVSVVPGLNISVGADTNVICGGDSVQLFANGGQGGAQYTWFPPTGLGDPNAANPMAAPGSSVTYTVTVAEAGCTGTDSVTISVIPSPEVSYVNSLSEGCAELTVSFLETTANAWNWVWDFGDGSSVQNTQNPSHTFSTPGTYIVTLTGIGPGDCRTVFKNDPIIVHAGPSGDFISDPTYPAQLAMPNTVVNFTSQMNNAVWYLWDFGDGKTSKEENPSHEFPMVEGTYNVTLYAKNQEGCMTTIVHGPYVIVTPEIAIPNIFSPNADGINDVFTVVYTGSQAFRLDIKDRWGTSVYSSLNKVQGWNGKVNGSGPDAAEGVYFYVVQIGDKSYTGNVTLVR